MEVIAPKSLLEIEQLAEGFASGRLFTGLHILLSPDYPDKGKALRTCFLPANTYAADEWQEWQRNQWVPYQWVKQASVQLSKLPPLYVFHTFEFMTFADAMKVLRYSAAIHKQRKATPPPAPAA